MKYAVIAISGTQYKVEENQTITVDKFDPTIKSTDQVLLVVDDDMYVLESVVALLGQFGYSVIPCRNGEEALQKMQG